MEIKKELNNETEEAKVEEKLEENAEASNQESEVKKEEKEKAPVNPKIVDIVAVDIKADNKETASYLEVIERERAKMSKFSKLSRILSIVSMAVVVALCVTGFFLVTVSKIAAFIVLGVAVALLLVSSVVVRIVAKPDVTGYSYIACREIDRRAFDDSRFTEVVFDPKHKVVLDEIVENGMYKDISDVVSRNFVTGKFTNKSFTTFECALYKNEKSKRKPSLFIGKCFLTFNELHFENRYVLVRKGETPVDTLNNIDDLTVLFTEGDLTIYGPADTDYKKAIPAKFIDEFKKFKVGPALMQIAVSLSAGKTNFFLSYADEVVTIPVSKPVDGNIIDGYREDLILANEASRILDK